MIGPVDLMLAFFLDLAIGDPLWLPHPVRMIGRAIVYMERLLRAYFREHETAAGILLVVSIVVPAGLLTFFVYKALLMLSADVLMIIGMALLVYLIATTIALRELIASAQRVIESVKDGALDAARKKLGMIVGRDTRELSEDGVLRATIETLAENLSDGIIAPVFYLVIGGLPLAIAYKAINTLDSMVGYKNETYVRFGWAAAKLDDIANYVPARVSGLFIAAAAFLHALVKDPGNALLTARRSFAVLWRDGRRHTSPNSGMPEAAMAGALGIRLGGPSTYSGILVKKPYIGDERSEDYLAAAQRAVTLVATASALFVITAMIVLGVRGA